MPTCLARLSPAEQPVLLNHRNHSQGALDVIHVDRYHWVVQGDRNADPALTDLCQRNEVVQVRAQRVVGNHLVLGLWR
jgi:hypothetical protein